MKVRVRAFGDLKYVVGNETTLDLKGNATIKHLISKLEERTGSTRKGFIGSYQSAGPDLVVLVNGRNVSALKGETYLKNGDVIVLLSPFIGG